MPMSQQPLEGQRIMLDIITSDINSRKVLDVGAGDGKWGKLLKDLVPIVLALEVWEPYIMKYKLDVNYDEVIQGNVSYFNKFEEFDVIILGDVLEHLEKNDALALVSKLKSVKARVFLTIPISDCPQDGKKLGNPYESHLYQWTNQELKELGWKLLHRGFNEVGTVEIGTYELGVSAVDPYAASKALWHPQHLLDIKEGRQPVPVQLVIMPINGCNHNCTFCAFRMDGYISTQKFTMLDRLSKEKCLEIIDDFASMGGKSIQFTGGGEPTLHPDWKEMMHLAHKLGLETAIVTNGNDLADIPLLLKSEWIRISWDAATTEMHDKMHRPGLKGSFDSIVRGVSELVKARNASPHSKLYIGVSFVVCKENWTEILDAVKLAKSIGVDNMRIVAVSTMEMGKYFDGFAEDAAALCKEAKTLSNDNFLVSNNFTIKFEDLKQGSPDYDSCPFQHLTTYIGADGGVYRCCVLSMNELGYMGSISDQSFKDFWNSEEKKVAMEGFNPSTHCPLCQFNDRNRQMIQLIKMIPTKHGNFT